MTANGKEQILIKNIYYMLAYAFQALRQDGFRRIEEESFDNVQDLFAAILSQGIAVQLKRGLYRAYVDKSDDLPLVRGKIDVPGTVRLQTAHRRLLRCEYDELSEDTVPNRILKTTALLLLKSDAVRRDYRSALKKEMPFFSGVGTADPHTIRWDSLHFQREKNYQMLMGICRLVLQGLLLTEQDGSHKLAAFLDGRQMCRLYEKFLLAYFQKEHPELKASSAQIPWALDDGMQTALPVMQSDITLQKGSAVLIIDAKYYAHTMQMQYGKRTIHSHNLYQIFAYVKNKEFALERAGVPHTVSGMLLYAKTTEALQPDSTFRLYGNRITVRTLDLYRPFAEIRNDLDKIANTL